MPFGQALCQIYHSPSNNKLTLVMPKKAVHPSTATASIDEYAGEARECFAGTRLRAARSTVSWGGPARGSTVVNLFAPYCRDSAEAWNRATRVISCALPRQFA